MTGLLFADLRSAYPLDAPEDRTVSYARCKREPPTKAHPRGDYGATYRGTNRAPRRPDELGAALVIDLMGGGRFVLFAIENNPDQMRVEELSSPTPRSL